LFSLSSLRITSSSTKVSALRPLGHALFAYAVAGGGPWGLLLANTLMLAAVMVGLSLLDDYLDWRRAGEANGFERLAEAGADPRRWLLMGLASCGLCAAPWLIAVTQGRISLLPIVLTVAGVVLVASYTLPPLRLKRLPAVSLWVAPLAAGLLFAQSYLVIQPVDTLLFALAGWCIGLQLYAELVHLLDDEPTPGIPAKLSPPAVRRWLVGSQLVMAGYAAAWALQWPLASLSVACALLRTRIAARASNEQRHRWRRRLWHPLWSVYDLLVYALVGLVLGGVMR
jgi:hypothetical protein